MAEASLLPGLKEQVARLVAQPSVSSTLPDHDQSNAGVIDCLAEWCETLGFEVQRIPVLTAEGQPPRYNLLARAGPSEGRGLIMSGHTDTVPWDERRWSSDPFQLVERDDRWYGLGVTDMKAFFALALRAAEPLLSRLRQPLYLLATADEESSMAGVRQMVPRLEGLDARVLIGEPTRLQPVRAHKGIMMEELIIEGRSGHSSDPALGINAIDAMGDALASLKALREGWQERIRNPDFSVPSPTLNFGCLHGGDNPNRICASCRLQFDVRLMPGMSAAQVREDVSTALQVLAERHGVAFTVKSLIEAVPPFESRTAGQTQWGQICEGVSGQSQTTVAYTTEAPFFSSLGLPTIVMGPGDIRQAHQPNEYLDLRMLEPTVKQYRALIQSCCVDSENEAGSTANG